MTALIQVGTPRLKVLDTDGTTVIKTLYLPAPDKGYPILEWDEKAFKNDLVTGAERTRRLGFIPVLTLKWKVYDDRANEGFTIGTADGNRPAYADLLTLLSGTPGLLRVSGGPSALGFDCDGIKVSPISTAAGFATGLQVVFRGRAIRANRDLATF